ncbi:hypothetical protein [Morganella morganii]|uniref:hypothetical protein n=1 Tax=Morganella morganii TaxID=582 RepID=UPI0021CE6C79|nr:hypothetical protein [Morganella morganii]
MLITSNVFNRIDWSVNGVEYRTGCYIQNINLGFIKTNFMNEPDFYPCIRFNQYDNSDEGFGTGWNLNLSCIKSIDNRRLLRLGNGSVYWIKEQSQPVPASGRTLELEDQYCKTFYCTEYPDNLISVFYKNGIREDIRDGYLSSVLYPNGYRLDFQYDDGHLILIYDGIGDTLLSVSYDRRNSDNIIVSVTNQRRKDDYYINKNKSGIYELNSVSTTSDSEKKILSLYTFRYQIYNNNYLLINELQSLQDHNRKEVIRYRDLVCPAGLSERVKGVSEQDIYNGNADDNKTYFTISYNSVDDHNFLGAGSNGVEKWQYGKDNLIPFEQYVFGCVVKKGNKLITHIYNNNYLISREEVTFSGTDKYKRTKIILYSYKKVDNEIFFFSLPVKKEEYYQDTEGKSDSAVTEYCHDQYENILEEVDCRGIKTIYSYYDGKTEYPNECPADIYGFDNYLKEKTIIPAGEDIPFDKKEYFYYSKVKDTSLIKIKKHIFSVKNRVERKDNIFESREYSYYNNDGVNGNIFKYGMISEEVSAFFSHTTDSMNEIRREVINYTVSIDKNSNNIHSVKKCSSGDFKDITVGEKKFNLTSGDLISEVMEDLTVIKYNYDNSGRIKGSIKSQPSDTIEYKTDYEYDSIGGYISCTEYSRPDITKVMKYNRLGRLYSVILKIKDGSELEKENIKYDRLGRVIEDTKSDYAFNNSLKKYINLSKKEIKYKWNFNDDITSHTGNYFSGQEIEVLHIKRSKLITSNDGKKTEVVTDSAGRVIKEIVTLNNNVINDDYYYNGYGQCSKQITTDSHGYSVTKEWRYNIRGWISEEKITTYNDSRTQKYHYDDRFRDKKLTEHHLNNRLIEVNGYDALGRLISAEKNQVKKIFSYNSLQLSEKPETEKIEKGREWKYTQTSSDKVVVKNKTLIMPSLPHISWRKAFNHEKLSGLLNNANAMFTFSGSDDRYTIKESMKYPDSWGHVGSKRIQYFCENKKNEKLYDVIMKYKFTTDGKLLSVSGGKYSETYKYNNGGLLQEVRYVLNKKIQCRCLFRYNKEYRVIDIFIDVRTGDNKKNKASFFTHIRHHYKYDECGRVQEITFSSDDATGGKLTPHWDTLVKSNVSYDSRDNITKNSIHLFMPVVFNQHKGLNSERSYRELRSFNGFDELTDCKYDGNLPLTNTMSRILSGQSYKYNDNGLIILSTRRFSSGTSDIVSYDYDDKSATLNTLTHCPFKAGWPETEKYTWNVEGMLISRTRSDGYKEEYEYGGEQNVVRMTITAPDNGKTIKTFLYDCHGHLVIQIIQSPPLYAGGSVVFRQIHDTYNNDHLMIRKIFDREVVDTSVLPEETHYYHWLQNQVIAVSVQDKTGNIKTHFNFNRPDGTTICRCSPTHQRRYVKQGVFDYRLKMAWIAQDQQGLFYQPEMIELQQVCFEKKI